MKMKKIVPFIIIGVFLLTTIPFVIVSAITGDGTILDENGKIVEVNIPFDESMNRGKMTREQLIQNEKELKEQLEIENKSNPANNSEKSMTDEELAELDAKAQKANETGNKLRELFSNGIKIVNRHYPRKYNENIEDLQKIDREMLETMVNVINENKLNENDEDVLKQCIAEKYFIILETDSIYEKVNKILGIDPNYMG